MCMLIQVSYTFCAVFDESHNIFLNLQPLKSLKPRISPLRVFLLEILFHLWQVVHLVYVCCRRQQQVRSVCPEKYELSKRPQLSEQKSATLTGPVAHRGDRLTFETKRAFIHWAYQD